MEHNWDINREDFDALLKSIIGNLKSIIGSGLISWNYMNINNHMIISSRFCNTWLHKGKPGLDKQEIEIIYIQNKSGQQIYELATLYIVQTTSAALHMCSITRMIRSILKFSLTLLILSLCSIVLMVLEMYIGYRCQNFIFCVSNSYSTVQL